MRRWVLIIPGALLLCAGALSPLGADELSEEEKAEKRLLFNQWVEKEIASREVKKESKEWSVLAQANFGFDNNVSLNSARTEDTFHEELLDLEWTRKHEGMPSLLGAGKWGAKFHSEFRDYGDEEGSDYHNMKLTPYYEAKVFGIHTLSAEYTLEQVRYIRNDQVNFYGQRARVRLTTPFGKRWAQRIYFLYRDKNYLDRKAKTQGDLPSDERRRDHYYEPGYTWMFFPSTDLIVSLTASYKFNESNDLFQDFNDYDGQALSGYVYFKGWRDIMWLWVGGWDHKDYANRLFVNSSEAEEDHYFYTALYAYIPLQENTQLVVSYTYGQNESNDPVLDYSGSSLNTGLLVKF